MNWTKEQLQETIKEVRNDCQEKILSDLEVIINTPIPKDMLEVIKTFVEIISVIQGQIDALVETTISQEIKIRQLEKMAKFQLEK